MSRLLLGVLALTTLGCRAADLARVVPSLSGEYEPHVVAIAYRDLETDRLWLWEVSDNLRKGAATNAVQIAEELLKLD